MLLLCAPEQPVEGQQDLGYTIQEMNVQIYSDGATSLDYLLDVEIDRARINISLPGKIYEDMLVTDDEGFLLDYKAGNNSIIIDVLGSHSVELSYTTSSLTNKTGATWSFRLTLLVEASIRLPPEATIMGMTPTPTSITMAGERITLIMPPGDVLLSYLLGVTGTREHAIILINEAEEYIEGAKLRGIKTDEAEALLQLAEEEYRAGVYVKAEEYANSATEKVREIEGLAVDAQTAINKAESAIKEAQASGRTGQLDEAESTLDEAETLWAEGAYLEAKIQAEEAERIAVNSEEGSKTALKPPLMIPLGASLVLIAILYWYMYRGRIDEGMDLELLFNENPHLRDDEREVIRYLADRPDGVFASDIRDELDIPRSTAWRMIKRLEEDGIIETDMVGRETHIRISCRYRSE
ncbi:MAG: MarR family transcriptional regulator [Candidatus Bathyarchaeia archaeon]